MAVQWTIYIVPVSTRSFNGIFDYYSTVYPEVLTGVVTPEKFFRTVNRVNTFLRNHLPDITCECRSLGKEFCPKRLYSKRIVGMVTDILDHETRTNYAQYPLRWVFRKRLNFVQNREHYLIEIDFVV